MEQQSIKSLYQKGVTSREIYLNRAREACKLTIPSLVPPVGNNSATSYPEPNQSIGADGLNNLSAKLAITLLPPDSPFFKFTGDSVILRAEAEATGADADDEEKKLAEGLSKLEQYIKDDVESSGDRVVLGEALKHLLLGNALLVDDKDDGLKYYPISRYIVKRAYNGTVLYVITEETIAYVELPKEVKEQLLEKLQHQESDKDLYNKNYNLYTIFRRTPDNKHWEVYSEVESITIESTRGTYPIDRCPAIPLRYTRIDGEDYGRGFIEEYIGDLRFLDQISKAIKEASLAASKFIVLVDPTGVTKKSRLESTQNGGYCVGREQDVSVLQANKYYDLKTAESIADKIEQRLARVFLLPQAAQRDAERVPTVEVQFMIKELQEALGNFYSILSKEFQEPYLRIKYFHLKKRTSNLPDVLKNKNINVTITTGLDSLGRNNEIQKLGIWLDMLAKGGILQQLGGDISKYGQTIADSLGLNVEGYLPTKEEQQQQAQQQQQAEMMKQAMPNLINQVGGITQNSQKSMLNEGENTNG